MRLINPDDLLKAMKKADEADPDLSTCWSRGSIRRAIDSLPEVNAVVLPCKLGDGLFLVVGKNERLRILPAIVAEIWWDKDGWQVGFDVGRVCKLDDYGKTMFKTWEEAAAALDKMKEG